MLEVIITNCKLAIGAIIGAAIGVISVYFLDIYMPLSTIIYAAIIATTLFFGLLVGAGWESS